MSLVIFSVIPYPLLSANAHLLRFVISVKMRNLLIVYEPYSDYCFGDLLCQKISQVISFVPFYDLLFIP